MKNEERSCTKCSSLQICSLFNKKNLIETNSNYQNSNEIELYNETTKHLNEKHVKYFFNWYKMLDLEFNEQKQFESGDLVWWTSQEKLEATGFSVFDLQLVRSFNSDSDSSDYTGEGFFTFEFKKTKKFIL